MIVTLTANPSVDQTVALTDPLRPGGVQQVSSTLSQAGGKGINISRACVGAEVATVAVLPAREGDGFLRDLDSDGIASRCVASANPIRVNLTISEPDGTTTKLNAAGSTVDPAVLDQLRLTLIDLAQDATWVVLAGSLPPGTPPEWYADLVTTLRTRTQVAVDTSNAPLLSLVERLDVAAPHVMKPNSEELASLTGQDAHLLESDPEQTARAAATLVDRGVGVVLASLGAEGAVLVTPEGAWHATPPPTEVISTVGAGDSSLFGYLLGDLRGLSSEERLALAVAYGSAAAGLPGTTIPRPDQVHPDLAVVRPIHHSNELTHHVGGTRHD